MIKYAVPALVLASLLGSPCDAEERLNPIGEWRVKDASAHIRVLPCDDKLWGVISWADKPGTDDNNPDPAKRRRPVLGLPILLAMQPAGDNRWSGEIYNADNGKIYDGSIRLKSAGTMHVEGCALKILCGGEDWTRLEKEKDKQDDKTICKGINEGR